ncbi:MAG: 13e12 repeat-containing protein, partial [Frankiales bacterium]|nr:13e12 repeat-containing protein [Frankiales bacterium]
FSHLPTLVLELVRAARDGRLAELQELSELDPQAVADLEELALATRDIPLPREPEDTQEWQATPDAAEVATTTEPAPAAAEDPYDDSTRDPYADLPHLPDEPPAADPPEPEPPAWDRAAQDAAFWRTAQPAPPQDPYLEVLLLRCLQMPLSKPVSVSLHIPMATALELTNAPGVLEGYGPLDAFRIRQVIPHSRLTDVYVDAETGVPLGTQPLRPLPSQRPDPQQHLLEQLARRLQPVTLLDQAEPQHDPSAALAAFVKLRDQRCSGPGCSMPASRCDLDHELEFPYGPTAEWNLGDKSRRCHGAKHHGWTATRHPDGTTEWVSPTGRTYRSASAWFPPPAFEKPPFEVYLPPTDWVLEIDLDDLKH